MIASETDKNITKSSQEDAPPIFKSWLGWYSIVLAILFVELILFYIIAKAF